MSNGVLDRLPPRLRAGSNAPNLGTARDKRKGWSVAPLRCATPRPAADPCPSPFAPCLAIAIETNPQGRNPMNTVNLIGRLTADPELRHTAGGTPVCTLRLAVNRPRKDGSQH